jgi:UPF0755 protein
VAKGRRAPARPPKGGRLERAKRVFLGIFVLLLLLLVPVALGLRSWWKLAQPYKGYAETEKLVRIEPGMGAGQILRLLEENGIVADAKTTRFYLLFLLRNPPIQAGEYRFSKPLSATAVLRRLINGEVDTSSVTLIEGLTLEETASQLAKAGMGRREAFLAEMRSPRLIADLDPEAQDLEGYLFPETYRFRRGTTEREIVGVLVQTFRKRLERDVRPRIKDHGQSLRHLVTLASIVEKEVGAASERPLVAAVYRNRLGRRIGLYADPTIIFALKKMGQWNGNLKKSDLRLDSPYNTYRYAGLPPGPICSPSLISLEAAAAPADVPYLYFVSRNDGTHVYASTEAEHNRNVERWQRQYFRDQRNASR